MTPNRTRIAAAVAASAATVALSAGIASAHVGTSTDEVAAGSSLALGLTIGHGCEGSPTREVAVQIPEGVNNATAFAHPGWTIESEVETLATPITSAHGDEVTERVSVITFSAEPGNELPNDVRDTFTINFTAPDTPGETLFFKTIQTCAEGSNDWIDEYDGTGEEPESPAPAVLVTEAAAGDDHHGGGTSEPAESESDGSGNGLAIAALVVGALGLLTGGAALARSRS